MTMFLDESYVLFFALWTKKKGLYPVQKYKSTSNLFRTSVDFTEKFIFSKFTQTVKHFDINILP